MCSRARAQPPLGVNMLNCVKGDTTSMLVIVSGGLPSDRVLLPVISHTTLPPCIMKFQNVRDISRGTWPTIYSLSLHARCSRHDHRSRPVGVALVVRQWRGSKHFCKHDVPSQLHRYLSTAAALHGRRMHTVDRGTYVTAHARSRTRSTN